MPTTEKPKISPTKIGSINIDLLLSAEGISVGYAYDGINIDTAIGYMTTTLDRMREERKYTWDTCPECKEPWASHFASDEDDDYEDDDE